MSTACRLFLNRGRISTSRLKESVAADQQEKEHKNRFEQSAGEGASAAEQLVGETGALHCHWHGFKLASLRQTLGLLGEFLKGRYRPAQSAG
jgi:hypothetical protein